MGGGQSNTALQYVESNLQFTATTETIIDLQSKVTGVGVTSQNITIIIGNSQTENVVIEGGITGNQRSVQNAKLIQTLASKVDAKQERDIQQSVMNDLQATMQQTQEFLNLSFLGAGQSNNTQQIIQNTIQTSVYDKVNYQSISRMFVSLAADQEGYVRIYGRNITINGGITFNQDVLFEIAAQQLVENTLVTVMNTQAMQDVENKVIAYLKQEQTGIRDIGRAAGDVMNGLFSGIMPIIIMLGVLAMGGGIFYIYYSNSKKHPKISEHDVTKELHAQEALTADGPVAPEVLDAQHQAAEAVGKAAGLH